MIYFVRHGKTDWNDLKKMQGIIDIPLNQEGIEYAHKLKELLKDKSFSAVFCSPLTRAKQTCDIILEGHKNSENINYVECLKERNYGKYAGQQKSSFDYDSFWDFSKPDNFDNFFKFAWPIANFIYNTLYKIYKNKDVLIISHGGVSKIFELFLGEYSLLPNDIGNYLPKNTQIVCYDFKDDTKKFSFNVNPTIINESEECSIVTPNIVTQNINVDAFDIKTEMPKLYERQAVILSNGNKLAIFKFKNINEIKLPGWKKTNENIENQIKRRTGYDIDISSLKKEQSIIEIKFNDKNGEVVLSTYYSAKIKEDIPNDSPDFNPKEIKEGGDIDFVKLFSLIETLKTNMKNIKCLPEEDDDYRPLASKQSIALRDRIVLEKFCNKILVEYFKNH